MQEPNLGSYNSMFEPYREPNIVKAKFVLSRAKIYTLEFDQNITMNKLKYMIQKAAHLRPNSFRLISNGEDYTKFSLEPFERLFPGQKLVVFTLELIMRNGFNETEFLLEMNSPCSVHIDKFLLYYCFTCGKSICYDCFTIGLHKGHQIQDKFFYLLPSKLLVEKLFESWSQNPYEDYKLIEDQTLVELRNNINIKIFDKLFQILRDIQTKVNNIIEQYHYKNIQLSEVIRNSVRDTKLKCIKILDDLKEKMNIKDIINNDHIFVDFDKAYKKLGDLHINSFNYNVMIYNEYTREIPSLVKNLVNDLNDRLFIFLNDIADNKKFESILNLIVTKTGISVDDKQIYDEITSHIKPNYDIYTKKRFTMNYKYDWNYNNFEKLEVINEQSKGKKTYGPDNNSLINTHLKIINNNLNKNSIEITNINFSHKEYPNLFNTISNIENVHINNNISNNKASIMRSNLNNNKASIISNNKASIISNNISNNNNINNNNLNVIKTTTTTTNHIIEKTIYENKNIQTGIFQSNISNKPIQGNINKNNIFASAQQNRQTTLILNKPKNTETALNRQFININNTLNDSFSSNSTLNNINKNAEDFLAQKKQKIISQSGVNNEISQTTINTLVNNNNNFNRNFIKNFSFGINQKILESTESEAEKYNSIKKYLNGEFILAPITQTNAVKIVTYYNEDERAIDLIFPKNLNIESFLLECGYCNFNKILYVTGGIKDKEITNICLSVNISKMESPISKLSSMIYKRCCHSMVSYDHYLMAVGGNNLSSVERYNTLNDNWEEMPQMNYKRMYPILVIYKEYLYAFFGKSNENEYCNTVERLKLNDGIKSNSWEMVQFNNPLNIDSRLYGCGVHVIGNLLYLFGGKCNDQTTNSLLFYNFDNNTLLKEKSSLENNQYFRENKMHEFGDKLVQIENNKFCGIYISLGAPSS